MLTLKGHHGAITTAGFSSDGKRLLTASPTKRPESGIWQMPTQQSGHWKSPALPK